MRKCAYAQVNHLKDLPEAKSAEEIRDIWKFFSNPQLKMMYQRLYRDYCDRFLGGLRFWREIQYKIVDEDKARKYMPDGDMNADISAEAVPNLCWMSLMNPCAGEVYSSVISSCTCIVLELSASILTA